MPAGRLMLAVAHSAVGAGVRLPNELTLLGKTLLNLDEVGPHAGARLRRGGVASGATPTS